MNFNDSLTLNYASFLNQVYIYVNVKEYKSVGEFHEKLNKKFKLQSNLSHEIIESCYWTLEDTEEAIQNFIKFGIQGPTRIDDNLGENYLRFYGILNTLNIQKSIIISLYEIFKVPNKNISIQEFKSSPIIELRNKLASHNVDYRGFNNEFDFYRIARFSIRDKSDKVEFVSKRNSREVSYLSKEISDFQVKLHSHLQIVCEHVVNRYFKPDSNKFKELIELCELLNSKRKGSIVSGDSSSGYIVIDVFK